MLSTRIRAFYFPDLGRRIELIDPIQEDQPGITAPLIGPESLEHLEDLLPVMEMTLSDDLREACDNLVPPGSAVANFHNTAGWMKGQIL